jgi:hypothetical protein
MKIEKEIFMKPVLIPAFVASLWLSAMNVIAQSPAVPAGPFVDEPIASTFNAQSPDAESLNAIAQALNGEASLKNSKITVQSDNGVVLLTGSAVTPEQVKRATEIALASSGDKPVVNVIVPDRADYKAAAQLSTG